VEHGKTTNSICIPRRAMSISGAIAPACAHIIYIYIYLLGGNVNLFLDFFLFYFF